MSWSKFDQVDYKNNDNSEKNKSTNKMLNSGAKRDGKFISHDNGLSLSLELSAIFTVTTPVSISNRRISHPPTHEECQDPSIQSSSHQHRGLLDKKIVLYKTEMCRAFEETGNCKYGARCQFAHSREELRPVSRHPRYKTEICKTFWDEGTCPYGRRCCFIHNENEVKAGRKHNSLLEFSMSNPNLSLSTTKNDSGTVIGSIVGELENSNCPGKSILYNSRLLFDREDVLNEDLLWSDDHVNQLHLSNDILKLID